MTLVLLTANSPPFARSRVHQKGGRQCAAAAQHCWEQLLMPQGSARASQQPGQPLSLLCMWQESPSTPAPVHSHTSSLDSLGSLGSSLLPNGAGRHARAPAGTGPASLGAYASAGARSIPSARRSYPPAEGSFRGQVQARISCAACEFLPLAVRPGRGKGAQTTGHCCCALHRCSWLRCERSLHRLRGPQGS